VRNIRISRPGWVAKASCRGGDPAVMAVFYPGAGKSAEPAKRICADCPVRIDCLSHALDHPEEQGIWGGTTDNERDRIRRRSA
jgi:WhiB family transcriptional regulator, redox-sensing transcriptional regulator